MYIKIILVIQGIQGLERGGSKVIYEAPKPRNEA